MLGMHPLAAVFGARPDLTDKNSARNYVKYLTKNLNLAVMFCRPLSKEPMDPRTAKDKEADQAAWEKYRQDAINRGDTPDPRETHPGGLYLATTNDKAVSKYITTIFNTRKDLEARNDLFTLRDHVATLSAGDEKSAARAQELGDEAVQEIFEKYTDLVDELRDLEGQRSTTKREERKKDIAPIVARTPLSDSDRAEWKTATDELAIPPANVAVEVGRSNLVVVDCDTAESVNLFQRWAAYMSGSDEWLYTSPTVSSPGVFDESTGQWVHRDGGHYYFRIPVERSGVEPISAELAKTISVKDPDNPSNYFDVAVNDRYILIPPSVRKEGAYTLTGPSHDIPDWFYDHIVGEGYRKQEQRQQRRDERARREGLSEDMVDQLEQWYEETPWSDILIPYGWRDSGHTDSCGCPIWSRPGGSHYKSATAHEPGCSQHGDSVDPPIHFWTTEPGEEIEAMLDSLGTDSRSLSKLQLAAAIYTDGDVSRALSDALDQPLDQTQYTAKLIRPGIAAMVEDTSTDRGVSGMSADPAAGQTNPQPAPQQLASPWDDTTQAAPQPRQPASPWDTAAAPQPGQPASPWDAAPAQPAPQNQTTDDYWSDLDEDELPDALRPGNGATTLFDGVDDNADTGAQEGVAQDEAVSSFTDPNESKDNFTYKTGSAEFTAPEVYTLDDMLARREPVKYLIKDREYGWVPEQGLTVIAGASNAGKSAVTLDMAATLAAEYNDPAKNTSEFRYWFNAKTKRRRVLYVAGEGIDGAVERVTAWEDYHEASVRNNMFFTEEAFKLDADETEWKKFGRSVERLGVDVVVIDTLAQALTGLEENSNDDMGKAVNWLIRFAEHHKVSIWLVHHTGKGDGPATPRGASALTGAVAAQIMVEKRPPESLSENMQDDFNDRGVTPIRVWSNKQKDARIPEPQDMSLVQYTVPPIPGRPDVDDFGEVVGRKTILIGDANGNLVDSYGPQPVLATENTPPANRSDASVLAEQLVDYLVQFGSGSQRRRQPNMLTRSMLLRTLYNSHGGDYFSRPAFETDFNTAVTLLVRSGAAYVGGSRIYPDVPSTTRASYTATKNFMMDKLNNISLESLEGNDGDAGDN